MGCAGRDFFREVGFVVAVWRQTVVVRSAVGRCWAHTPSHPSRRVRRLGRLASVFLHPPGALLLGGAAAFGAPLGGLGQNLIQRREAGHRHADQGEVVAARPRTGLDRDQQRADQSDVDLQGHPLLRFGIKMFEVGHALEPAEKQLDLPTVPIDDTNGLGRQIEAIGQQPQGPIGLVRLGDLHQPQRLLERGAVGAATDAHHRIGEHTAGAIGGGQRARFERFVSGGLAQPHEEVAALGDDVGQQLILLKAAVADVKAAAPQCQTQLFGFAGPAVGQGDAVRHFAQNVEVQVSPHVALGDVALGTVVVERPGDSGGDGEERAVYGHELVGEPVEARVVFLNVGPLFERLEQRQEQFGIEEPLRVGQRALGHARHFQPPPHAGDVEDVLDLSQTGQDRVEEGEQMGDDELVVKESAVAVAAVFAQMLQLAVEQTDEPPAHDLTLRDGDRVRAFGAGNTPACHADQ